MGKAARNRRRHQQRGEQESPWSAQRAAHRLTRLQQEVVDRLADNDTYLARQQEMFIHLLRETLRLMDERGVQDPLQAALQALWAPQLRSRSARELTAELARRNLSGIVAQAKLAESYVISPAMHASAAAAAETLDEDDCARLEETEVPATHGMLLLPTVQPFQREHEPAPLPLAALSWTLDVVTHPWHGVYQPRPPDPTVESADGGSVGQGDGGGGGDAAPAPVEVPRTATRLLVRVWADCAAMSDAGLSAVRADAREAGEDLPGVVPVLSTHLLLGGVPGSTDRARARAVGPHVAPPPELIRRQLTGTYAPDAMLTGPLDSWALRYLFAFFRLCRQRIATTPRLREDAGQGPPRPQDMVRVVTLRSFSELARPDHEPQHPRRYEHRWLVRMHRVNQWYPSQGVHRIIWRGPYIKGPDHAPLLAGEKVYALTR